MGEYIYKTVPSAVSSVTVLMDDGRLQVAEVACYQYAYKPYWSDEKENRRMDRQFVAPARAAWKRTGKQVPALGVTIHEPTKPAVAINDRVFETRGHVALGDYDWRKVGTVVSLHPSGRDERTFAERISPGFHGYPHLSEYVGSVIGHEYTEYNGWKLIEGKPLDFLDPWKAKLAPADRALFEQRERQ